MLPMLYVGERLLSDQVAASRQTPGALAFAGLFTFVMGMAGPWIAGALVSLLAMMVGRILGHQLNFGQYFGMVGYARLPLYLGTLLTAGLNLAGVRGFTGRSPLSLAGLLPAGASPYLSAVAGAIAPFELWYFVLLAIGFATLHRVRIARGTVLPVLIFLLGIACEVFMAAR